MAHKTSLDESVIYSSAGGSAWTPLAAPSRLDAGQVAPSRGGSLVFELAFQTGPLTTAGAAFVTAPVERLTLPAQTPSTGTASSGSGAGKVTFEPFTLTFAPSAVTPTLLSDFLAGASFSTFSLIGANAGFRGVSIFDRYDFKLVTVKGLTFDALSGLTVTLDYGAEQFRVAQQQSLGFGVPSVAAPLYADAPAWENFGRGQGGAQYYVEFLASGSTAPVSINGASAFRLSDFSFSETPSASQSTGSGAGQITFNPLTLDFASGVEAANFYAELAAANEGTGLYDQIDVFSYDPTGRGSETITRYEFKLAAADSLNASATGSVGFQFGGLQIQTTQQQSAGGALAQPTPVTTEFSGENAGRGSSGGGGEFFMTFIPRAAPLQGESTDAGLSGPTTPPPVFHLSGYSFTTSQSSNVGSQSSGSGAGKITFSPLTLTFAPTLVTGTLIDSLLTAATQDELSIETFTLNAGGQTGQTTSQFYFKLPTLTSLALDSTGQLSAVIDFGAEAAGVPQTTPTGVTGTPASNPSSPTPVAANDGGSTGKLSYYASFQSSQIAPGGWSRVDNGPVAQSPLYALQDFSFSSAAPNVGSTSANSPSSLTLDFTQPELTATLLPPFDTGKSFDQIQVFSYETDPTSGQTTLVSAFDFAGAFGASLTLNGQGAQSLVLSYEALANGSASQTLDPTTVSTAPANGKITYYVRFEPTSSQSVDTALNSGPAIDEITGGSLFKLTNFDTTLTNADAASASTGAGAGKVTYSPLDLSFANGDLTAGLFQVLTKGYQFGQVEVLGYDSNGNFATGYAFNLDTLTNLSSDQSGVSQATLAYGGENTVSPTDAANPPASTLEAAQVAPSEGGGRVDYYVRFYEQGATTPISAGGDDLFALSDWTFTDSRTISVGSQSSGAGVSKPILGPLDLTLAQNEIPASLLADLVNGTVFGEVDVLGYQAGRGGQSGALVSDNSFGSVTFGTPGYDGAGGLTLAASYASQSIQTYESHANV